MEEYADLFRETYEAYTVEELFRATFLRGRDLSDYDFDTFTLPHELADRMKPVHARKFEHAVRYEFGSVASSFSYTGNMLLRSGVHVEDKEIPYESPLKTSPQSAKTEEKKKTTDEVTENTHRQRGEETDGIVVTTTTVESPSSKTATTSRVVYSYSTGTFVAMRSEIATEHLPTDVGFDPPTFWLGRIDQSLPHNWYRVRIFAESGPNTRTFVKTTYKVVVSGDKLEKVEPPLQFDSDLKVWCSPNVLQPTLILLPGIPPVEIARTFQAESSASANQVQMFATMYLDIPLAHFQSDHRNEQELHACLKRYVQQFVALKFSYTPTPSDLENACFVEKNATEVLMKSRERITAIDFLIHSRPQPVHIQSNVTEISAEIEQLLRKEAFKVFVKRSTDVDVLFVANVRVCGIVCVSGQRQHKSFDVVPKSSGDPIEPGDFVAFKNMDFAPIAESVDRPEWWICRVERRVWGNRGLLVHLRWYKETTLGSGMYRPTNGWFIKLAEELHWANLRFDTERVAWVAGKAPLDAA